MHDRPAPARGFYRRRRPRGDHERRARRATGARPGDDVGLPGRLPHRVGAAGPGAVRLGRRRAAGGLGAAGRQARSQRRLALPARPLHHERRPPPGQRHLPRRRHRLAPARRVPPRRGGVRGRGRRQPQRHVRQPRARRHRGAVHRRRGADRQVPAGVPHRPARTRTGWTAERAARPPARRRRPSGGARPRGRACSVDRVERPVGRPGRARGVRTQDRQEEEHA